MITSAPFLLFDGNCAEAMAFYRDCLGGDLTLIRLGVQWIFRGGPIT